MEDLRTRPCALGRRYSPASVHQYVRSARAFFNWLFEEEYTDFHYLARLEWPRLGEKVPRALSDEEVNLLLRQPEFQPDTYRGMRNLCMALLLLETWARLSEIAALPLANVHVADGWILVHGKGGRERALRFGRTKQEHLLRYIDCWRPAAQRGHDHFFLTQEAGTCRSTPFIACSRASGSAPAFQSAPIACGTPAPRPVPVRRCRWTTSARSSDTPPPRRPRLRPPGGAVALRGRAAVRTGLLEHHAAQGEAAKPSAI